MRRRVVNGTVAAATFVAIRYFGVVWWQAMVAGLVAIAFAELVIGLGATTTEEETDDAD
jgi:hypothetical protein